MEKNNRFFDNAEAIFKGMNTFLTTKTVVGEPIVVGESTIIPLVDVSCGMATGTFEESSKSKGGGGMSAKITPTAMLIIQDGRTKVVNIKNQDAISKILDMVPDLINKVSNKSDVDKETTKKAETILNDSESKYID
ncbi:GerW family sporulation protein [Lachnoanaerobaculum sp. Marseille-Q4761]|uniref:GerW family sporulation protein n=1 Tax=Lachnoanaerobaculum sp. Marseille-Q4761 TaxID=2819511 RepID=UPI001AA12029|nr:GerW family sporulation protein [Lachnoanaerobaculum sp. Marseille-Q4761]MBO1871640.1 GerW family sporulation protein [Lachnoanaerobaculum sp. Marseille-Q4761]